MDTHLTSWFYLRACHEKQTGAFLAVTYLEAAFARLPLNYAPRGPEIVPTTRLLTCLVV